VAEGAASFFSRSRIRNNGEIFSRIYAIPACHKILQYKMLLSENVSDIFDDIVSNYIMLSNNLISDYMSSSAKANLKMGKTQI
jgi:hypothetical protein